MTRSETGPVRMERVAVAAPLSQARAVLVQVGDTGVMEFDDREPERQADLVAEDVAQALRDAPSGVQPRLDPAEPDVALCRDRGQWDRIAGEAELQRRRAGAVDHGPAVVLLGWVPAAGLTALRDRLTPYGCSVVQLPLPRTAAPPTFMSQQSLGRSLRPLVSTYSVVPYRDVDPTLFAGITYVLMFGMMFGDVGHGLVLAALGVLLARSTRPRFARVRRLWPFPVAAGLVAALFGLLYGEAFGPTGLVPTLWLSPLEEPVRLLVAAIGLGAVLLGAGYAIGAVNRWREGGPRLAIYSPSGLAGVAIFLGGALLAGGLAWGSPSLRTVGTVLGSAGLVLTFLGLRAQAGSGGAAIGQALIEVVDTVVRIVANVVSFGRLAAFGLTHAAIGAVVWNGAQALWGSVGGALGAVVVFTVGNALAFALEALVVGVQALRLEYYELFSRIFTGEGRQFHPWHVPMVTEGRS